MRLWHSKLIPLLDGRRLCDLHMSCCNLRGLGWGKRNKNIDYIYDDPLGEDALAIYHVMVLEEMSKRGYKFDVNWLNIYYCGKRRPSRRSPLERATEAAWRNVPLKGHTPAFYISDVEVLRSRGLDIELNKTRYLDDVGYIIIYKASCGDRESCYGVRL